MKKRTKLVTEDKRVPAWAKPETEPKSAAEDKRIPIAPRQIILTLNSENQTLINMSTDLTFPIALGMLREATLTTEYQLSKVFDAHHAAAQKLVGNATKG